MQQQLNGSNLYRYGDSVDLWIMNMDDDTYKFLSACSDELENTGFFASPPGNVPSNIIGGTDLATQAVGHFGAYNVIKFSTVVPVSVYY